LSKNNSLAHETFTKAKQKQSLNLFSCLYCYSREWLVFTINGLALGVSLQKICAPSTVNIFLVLSHVVSTCFDLHMAIHSETKAKWIFCQVQNENFTVKPRHRTLWQFRHTLSVTVFCCETLKYVQRVHIYSVTDKNL
jgi:hypothetical protein